MARSTSPTTRSTTTPSTQEDSAVTVKDCSGAHPGLISVTPVVGFPPRRRATLALIFPDHSRTPSHSCRDEELPRVPGRTSAGGTST